MASGELLLRVSGVAYFLFLCANAALFVRPAELLPALGNAPIYLVLIGSAMACNLRGLQNQLRKRTLLQQPVNLCMLGVVIAVPVSSVLGRMYLSGAFHGFVMMAKIACYYLMLVSVITTPQRMRQFLMTTGLCSVVLVAVSVQDFLQFKREWQGNDDELWVQMEKDKLLPPEEQVLHHVVETHGYDILGNQTFVFRMRGLGIFNDPNDVALLIAVAGVICLYFLTDKGLSTVRWLWIIPLLILAFGYLQTQSRGGLLAIGGAGTAWLAVRYGGRVAIALGLMGALAAPLVLGRAAEMDVSDGSGQARVQIWSDGLQAMKSPKALFRIGEGYYEEVAGHVAHNSYIHAWVELGIVGGTLFFGCFFIPAYGFFLMKNHHIEPRHREVARMMPYVAAILAAWCAGMATLSRCYAPSTYMIVGLCAAFLNLAGFFQLRPYPIVPFNRVTVQRCAACSMALLAASFLFVKVFARFGT